MRLEYSARSAADLREIAAYTREKFGEAVALALEQRFRMAIEQIRTTPMAAPQVEQRPGVRVLSLVRYPYRIFYRVREDRVTILHIRHTSRRPWV